MGRADCPDRDSTDVGTRLRANQVQAKPTQGALASQTRPQHLDVLVVNGIGLIASRLKPSVPRASGTPWANIDLVHVNIVPMTSRTPVIRIFAITVSLLTFKF
jgi:hypothetical protein